MRFRRRGLVVSAIARPTCLGVVLIFCAAAAFSSEQTDNRIICRDDLSLARRDELAGKLRAITGWPALKFDQSGVLHSRINEPDGGSKTARELLTRALSGDNVLILEDASNRSDVVFCRVVPGRWKRNVPNSPPVFVVLIDFADFEHLLGDQAALNAFDVGWGFLHEVDHVVNHSLDSDELGQTGECEDHINQMRRELNLPERTDYYFTLFPHADESPFLTRFVRLAFELEDSSSSKHRRFWLVWDASLVGGLNEQKQLAGLRWARNLP